MRKSKGGRRIEGILGRELCLGGGDCENGFGDSSNISRAQKKKICRKKYRLTF